MGIPEYEELAKIVTSRTDNRDGYTLEEKIANMLERMFNAGREYEIRNKL